MRLVAATVAACAVALTFVAGLGAAPVASAAAEFRDPTGDSGAAPDIDRVQVGNDLVTGHVVLWVKLANRMRLDADDEFLAYFDADLSGATGGPAGEDFAVYVDGGGTKVLARFSSETMRFEQVPAPTLSSTFFSTGWLGIRIHPSDLGGTRAFNFYLVSGRGDADDVAPDGDGLWSYSLAAGPLRLGVDGFVVTPKPARAGKALTATMDVFREDILDSLSSGQVTCSLVLKGKALRPVQRGFGAGGATCRFALPKGVRGAYRLTMTVAFGGAKVTRVATGTVR
jgi:hypothetical protein